MISVPFTKEWLGIEANCVWLEAESNNGKDDWTVFALGSSTFEQSRVLSCESLDSFADFPVNADSITKQDCDIIDFSLSFRQMLGYMIFFEGLRDAIRWKHPEYALSEAAKQCFNDKKYSPDHVYNPLSNPDRIKASAEIIILLSDKLSEFESRLDQPKKDMHHLVL